MENKINIDKLKALGAIDCPNDKKPVFQTAVDSLCRMNGWSPEHPVLVTDKEQVYICYGSGKESDPISKFPDCSPFYCIQVDPKVAEICKEEGWPCDLKVVVYYKGEYCLCKCC